MLRVAGQPVSVGPEFSGISKQDSVKVQRLIFEGRALIGDNTDSALSRFQEARQLSFQNKFYFGLGETGIALSLCYADLKDKARSFACLEEAKRYCDKLRPFSDKTLMKWYRAKAVYYNLAGKNDSSVVTLMAGVVLGKRLQDTPALIGLYNDLGAAWNNARVPDNAIYYLKEAESIYTYENKKNLLGIYANLAIAYNNKPDTALMVVYAHKTLKLSKAYHNIRYRRFASIMLAEYYFRNNEPERAAQYYEDGLKLIDKSSADASEFVHYNLSTYYYRSGDLKRSLHHGLVALDNANPADNKSRAVSYLYNHLAKVYKALGIHDKAYEFQLKYANLSDSLNDLERSLSIDRLQAQYKLAEKDNQLLQQQARIRNRTLWIIAIGAGTILAGIIAALSFVLYRNSKREMKLLEKQKEIDVLKAVLNGEEQERNRLAKDLHDGVGGMLSAAMLNLNHIPAEHMPQREGQAYKKVQQLISDVSNEVRKTAHNLMPDVIVKHSLEDAIRLYCSHVKRDAEWEITFQSTGDSADFEQEFKLSVYRIAQELLQNILKHAHATTAFVQLQRTHDLLTLTVEDNGRGFDATGNMQGIGLDSIKSRVAAFAGTCSIHSSQQSGTSVYIEFDLKNIMKVIPEHKK